MKLYFNNTSLFSILDNKYNMIISGSIHKHFVHNNCINFVYLLRCVWSIISWSPLQH